MPVPELIKAYADPDIAYGPGFTHRGQGRILLFYTEEFLKCSYSLGIDVECVDDAVDACNGPEVEYTPYVNVDVQVPERIVFEWSKGPIGEAISAYARSMYQDDSKRCTVFQLYGPIVYRRGHMLALEVMALPSKRDQFPDFNPLLRIKT